MLHRNRKWAVEGLETLVCGSGMAILLVCLHYLTGYLARFLVNGSEMAVILVFLQYSTGYLSRFLVNGSKMAVILVLLH